MCICIKSDGMYSFKSQFLPSSKTKSQTSLRILTEVANLRKKKPKPKDIKGATSVQTQESLSLFPRLHFSFILSYSTVQIAELKNLLISNIKAQSNKAVV